MGFAKETLLIETLIAAATTLGSGHGPLKPPPQSVVETLKPQLSIKPFLTEGNQIPLSRLREFSPAGGGLFWRPVSGIPLENIEKEMPWCGAYLDKIKKITPEDPKNWQPPYIMIETGPWSENTPQVRFTEISVPIYANSEGSINIVTSRSQVNGRPGKIELRVSVLRITQEDHAVMVTEYLSTPLSLKQTKEISMGLTPHLPNLRGRSRTIFLPRSQISAEQIRAANAALWTIPWQNALLSTGIIDNDGLRINYTKLQPPIGGSFPPPNKDYSPGRAYEKHPPRLAKTPGWNHLYSPLRQKYHWS